MQKDVIIKPETIAAVVGQIRVATGLTTAAIAKQTGYTGSGGGLSYCVRQGKLPTADRLKNLHLFYRKHVLGEATQAPGVTEAAAGPLVPTPLPADLVDRAVLHMAEAADLLGLGIAESRRPYERTGLQEVLKSLRELGHQLLIPNGR